MHKVTEQIIPIIAAIEPCYGNDGGNATRVYTTGGDAFTDRRRLKSVLDAIFRYYGKTVPAVREKYGALLKCKHYVPLPLSQSLVLFQFKARVPQFLHDGASGFINACAVQDITKATAAEKEKGIHSLIFLTGGHTISSCYSHHTIEGRMNKAEMAMVYFEKLHGFNNNQPVLVREKEEMEGFSCPAACCYNRCGSRQQDYVQQFSYDNM